MIALFMSPKVPPLAARICEPIATSSSAAPVGPPCCARLAGFESLTRSATWDFLAEDWGIAVKHFLLFYEAGPEYLARRPDFRGAHLKHAWDAHDRGELIVAGALADPVDGAVLMFRGADMSVAETFASADPYVTAGLVARWHVREWTTVVGGLAANLVRLEDL